MRLGFILDQTKCIGCHACTVACKSENDVPVGVFRTWVKHIEKGTFPDTRRHFAVLRCNQCDDAPCMTICPTSALFRRPDGIVDFDSDACIGCKSCMQACPYDALYIDPDTNTAAKCNLCSHRVDAGLQPACQIVCPTQAIVSGDFDDPASDVSRIASRQPVQVRKPDQGTRPKVFYVGADAVALDPRIERDVAPMFTDPRWPLEGVDPGPTRDVYDVEHPAPWGWKVWLYLWTKSIAAGTAAVASAFSWATGAATGITVPLVGLIFIGVTTGLLVFDLKRPERFWYLLVRPNFSSWLVWGGYILGLFSAFCAAWLFVEPAAWWFDAAAIALGAATAGYTAFLFHQAEGRDFWQSPLLLVHLLVEAALCGAAALAFIQPSMAMEIVLGASVALHFLVIRIELSERHGNVDVRNAAKHLSGSPTFLPVVAVVGTLAPLALLGGCWLGGPELLAPAAAILALAGALEYGRLWIRAGQAVKLS